MKKLGRKCILLAIVAVVPLLLVGTVVWIIDPFFVYHGPLEGAYYTIDNQLEQNPGIAKHFEYDSVMLGSSMTTNFDTNQFDEQLDSCMVKLSYNAAYPKDIDRIMEIVAEEKESLKHVFLCIDIANYMSEPGILSYQYPEHLYDKNVFNDLKYLLSKEVFFNYIVDSYLGKKQIAINEIYWHWQYMTYDRDHVLSNYTKPDMASKSELDADADAKSGTQVSIPYTLENLKINLEECIIPYIEAMPNTQWHIFFPPYSMLYWYDSMASGEVEIKVEGMDYITQCLGQYGNVEVHYFQDVEEWITDLDNYTDKTHFSKQVTDDMTKRLCQDTNKVSLEDYKQQLEAFEEFLLGFDYEGFVKVE